MSDPRTKLVGAGYDAMIDTWETWSAQINDDPRAEWLDKLTALLPAGGSVLELGCGGGTAESRELAARFRLTGVDLSTEQLLRAQLRIPSAEFLHGDLATHRVRRRLVRRGLRLLFAEPPASRVARRALHEGALLAQTRRRAARLARRRRRGGLGGRVARRSDVLLELTRPRRTPGSCVAAGFDVLEDEVVGIDEPEGRVEFQWILARR